MSDACCTPGPMGIAAPAPLLQLQPARHRIARGKPASARGMAEIPAGRFAMGVAFVEGYPADGEGPVHEVELAAFRIDATTVTNEQFA